MKGPDLISQVGAQGLLCPLEDEEQADGDHGGRHRDAREARAPALLRLRTEVRRGRRAGGRLDDAPVGRQAERARRAEDGGRRVALAAADQPQLGTLPVLGRAVRPLLLRPEHRVPLPDLRGQVLLHGISLPLSG